MTSPTPETLSPLEAIHTARNARFTDYAGKSVPADYGDTVAEHHAVTTGVGLADLSAHGRLEATGKERVQFINGMVSNYVKPLAHGFGVPALFLTAQGKVTADCRVYGVDESLWLDFDAASFEKMHKSLFRLTFAGDFKIADRTKTHGLLTLQGPNAGKLLAAVTGVAVDGWSAERTVERVDKKEETIPVLPLDRVTIGGVEAIAVRRDRTGRGGYDLYVPNEGLATVWETLETAGAEFGLRPVGWDALDILRVEAGLPRYGVDFDDSVIALEAGLDAAVSYNKGCYVGQETVAKIHWRGHDQVAKRLKTFLVSGDTLPAKGTPIVKGEKEIGQITSAVTSVKFGKILAFGYIRSAAIEPGATFALRPADGSAAAATLRDE